MYKFNLNDFSVAPQASVESEVYLGVPRQPVMFRSGQDHKPRELLVHYCHDEGQWYLVHREVVEYSRLQVQVALIVEGIQKNGMPFLSVIIPPKFQNDSSVTYDSLKAAFYQGIKSWICISKSDRGGYTHELVNVDQEPAWGSETIEDLIVNAFANRWITKSHPLALRSIRPIELPIEEEVVPFHAVPVTSKSEPVCMEELIEDGEEETVITPRKATRSPLRLRKTESGWSHIS